MHPLDHAKKFAHDLRHLASVPELRLATFQEATARIFGYRDWHHLASDPSHQPEDIDARRWRAVRELAATGTSEDILGIINRLLPDPAIARARQMEDLLSVFSLHPVTKGYDDLVRMLYERHGPEFKVVAEDGELVHSAPLGRGTVHRDAIAFLELISDAYWSIFGMGPDEREVYRVDHSHLRFDRWGFEAEMVTSEDWIDRRPGLRIAAGYDGTISTHVLLRGAPDIADPERALNVWRNVNDHGWQIDFHGVTDRTRENDLDVFRVETEDVVRMIWSGREGYFDDPADQPAIPHLEYPVVVDPHDDEEAADAYDAIGLQYGNEGFASRTDVERAGRFLASRGIELPRHLAVQWLASEPKPHHKDEPYHLIDLSDMGEDETEFERRATPDAVIVAESGGGAVLWVTSDGHWHTNGKDHGPGPGSFLTASKHSYEAALMHVEINRLVRELEET